MCIVSKCKSFCTEGLDAIKDKMKLSCYECLEKNCTKTLVETIEKYLNYIQSPLFSCYREGKYKSASELDRHSL